MADSNSIFEYVMGGGLLTAVGAVFKLYRDSIIDRRRMALDERKAQKDDEVKEAEVETKTTSAKVQDRATEITVLEHAITSLQRENSRLVIRVNQLESRRDQQDKIIAELRNKQFEQQASYEEQVSLLRSEAATLGSENTRLSEKIARLQELIDRLGPPPSAATAAS